MNVRECPKITGTSAGDKRSTKRRDGKRKRGSQEIVEEEGKILITIILDSKLTSLEEEEGIQAEEMPA